MITVDLYKLKEDLAQVEQQLAEHKTSTITGKLVHLRKQRASLIMLISKLSNTITMQHLSNPSKEQK